MRVYGLDENFNRVKEFKYIELSWNRKFYEPGDYLLYIPATDMGETNDVRFIQVEGRDELGFVYKTGMLSNIEGVFVTLEGRFAEDLANDATTDMGKNILSSQNMATVLCTYLTPLGVVHGGGTLVARNATVARHAQVGDEIYRILKTEKESYRITYVDGVPEIEFVQAATIPLQISKRMGNAAKIEYSSDVSDYFHICKGYIEIPKEQIDAGYTGAVKIGGKWYEQASYTSTLTVSPRLQKRTLSREYSLPEGLECIPANKTQIQDAIENYCRLELLDHYIDRTVDVETLQKSGCRYLVDYDLGDILSIYIEELDITFEAQIVEVRETWKKNRQEYKLIFDNKKIKRRKKLIG